MLNYTTKTFIIKTTPMRNPFRIPPILMWLFFVVHRPNSKFENIFYNLSSFVLVSPIIANWQNPRCNKAPQINIKMKQLQQRPLPARDVRPLTTIFVWPSGQIKDKNKYSGLGPVPSCIPNQSQPDLPTSHLSQLPHDSSVIIILLLITGYAVRATQTIFCGL